tara:strand:+ start:7260 stop:8078 length:819 start_codon:yes stop_codon:yes gene_type:complete
MPNHFLSDENKALLWQLLDDSNAFSNIPDEYFDRVKNLYETTLNEVNNISNIGLVDKNKTVIAEMIDKLPYLKNNSQLKPLEEVKITVDQNFKNKQEEFIQLVNHKKPEKPNFTDETDKTDTPLDTVVMNNMLNNMMAMREKELNQVPPPLPQSSQTSDNYNLKHDTKLEIKELKNTPVSHDGTCKDYIWSQWGEQSNKNDIIDDTKKVSFDTNFISKLKKVEDKPLTHPIQKNINLHDDRISIIHNEIRDCMAKQEKISIQLNNILKMFEQ